MSAMEKKLDALMQLVLAEDEASRKRAMTELRRIVGKDATVVPAPLAAVNPEKEIRKLLLELGMPENIKGHRYTIEAVKLAVADGDIIDAITKEMYPKVAKAFGTMASRVDRGIRHSVEVTWHRGNPDVLGKYFGNTVSCDKGKPTNGEFIARLANIVREKMEEA